MVSKGPICDREMAWAPARAADHLTSPDDTLCGSTINDPIQDAASRLQHQPERVKSRRRIASGLWWGWLIAVLTLSAGCAPTIDEDARLAGIGTSRAAPEPNPVPCFTATDFVAADGQ